MDWYTRLDRQIAEYLPDLKVVCDEPMCRHTSFRVGGPAKRMAFPKGREQLVRLIELADACGVCPLVIGNGTNLLISDEGLHRLVINTSEGMICLENGLEPNTIVAEAGVSLAQLADFSCKQGQAGLEFAHGIPGSVGGAVCMNAGAYDGEMKQVIQNVTILFPGEGIRTLSNEEMDFGYRHSLLTKRPDAVVLCATFQLTPDDPDAIREKMRDFMARRKASQPLEYPSAGSTFKRPDGYFAGKLIQDCGLKGLTVGGAQVSEKHAGFVINKGGASCADVLELIRQIQMRVLQETGVQMEPEVKIIQS